MRSQFRLAVLVVLCLFVVTEPALAWGPGMHVDLAATVLSRLALLPAALAALLGRHAVSYIYGCVAADVVFAKRLSRIKQFCHHWSTGLRLLNKSESDRSQAFALGYLSHLAADTVAHGKFVPLQIMTSRCTVGFGHLYWELRADATVQDDSWQLLETVTAADHEDHHEKLERLLTDTFLSFDWNRVLFQRFNALAANRGFRRTIDMWDRCSRWELPEGLLEDFRSECVERILSVLTEGDQSKVLREDPNGTSALMRVRAQRRDVRRMSRKGMPVDRRIHEASQALGPRLAASTDRHPTALTVS